MIMPNDDGRVPAAPGSREPRQEVVSAASGFDPSRKWGWWAGTSEEFMNLGGPFATREEAIAEGRHQQCGDPFWIVEARLAEWSPPDAEDVMNRLAESGDDYQMFYEDGFPGFDCSAEVEKQAEADLQGVLTDWFARWRHILPSPTAFSGTSGLEQVDALPRDSDRSSEAGETAQHGSTEGESAGLEEASPNTPLTSQDHQP
jgi:hypothetical protein